MAGFFQSPVNVVQVGSYFVGQYYQVIQQQPDQAFNFYTDASTVMRIDGSTSETATSTMQIHSLLMSLKFAGIEIKNAHSLNSWDRGVLVVVSGIVQMINYSGRRNFVQTFFLAPQESGYFVLNDILYLLDEETVPQLPSSTALAHSSYESNSTTLANSSYESNSNVVKHPVPEPVSGYMVGEEIQTRDYVAPIDVLEELQATDYMDPFHTDEDDMIDKYSIPEPLLQVSEIDNSVDETPVDEPVASYPTAVSFERDPPAPAEELIGERPKQTYASILRLAKGQSGNFMPRAAPVSRPALVASDAQLATPQHPYSPQHPYPLVSTRPERSTPAGVDAGSPVDEEGEVKSVYVGNLSSSVSADDLEQEFRNFGRIRPDGVNVRTRKETGGFYAFVEFEDAASVQNALKASPILINGRQIYVEERRPNSGISRVGGARRGRGRGVYSSDGSRGRFGGRGFNKDGGTDNGDRELNGGRSRGNGILNRVPRQERGILGNGQNSYQDAY